MGLKSSGILALMGVSLYAPNTLANKNVTFYGNVATGFHSHNMEKIDTTDSDIASAVTRSGATVPSDDRTYSVIGSGYTVTKFGLDYVASEKVKGKLEFKAGIGETGSDGGATVRKYYLITDIGAGKLRFGRDNRLFSSVSWYADSFKLASLSYAGSVYGPSRAAGITYDSADLLGPATFKLALINPTSGTAGPKPQGGNPEPTIEALVGFHQDSFWGGLGSC